MESTGDCSIKSTGSVISLPNIMRAGLSPVDSCTADLYASMANGILSSQSLCSSSGSSSDFSMLSKILRGIISVCIIAEVRCFRLTVVGISKVASHHSTLLHCLQGRRESPSALEWDLPGLCSMVLDCYSPLPEHDEVP
ncbi:uncharacterized protein [Diadema setosum]|uniref:uncharacterized protein n=1 Tax=Diadema setosum TaxID=31175 RepID=UPI003B3B2195